ncbi:hypothetical protein R1sor_023672 [Riccia sorocarpa]|uniref:Carbohydrate kinase PfkB domain-containing protein n=1 Tax=Riccia sorocarpa TaxID=122646 RepID=A0ABD3GQ50_9MARC
MSFEDGLAEDEGSNGDIKQECSSPILVVGHYCHDKITLPGGRRVDALGGSVSYITNVFEALGVKAEVVSKVGPDFIYGCKLKYPPLVVGSQCTTEFFADFTAGDERLLKVGHICEAIYPRDILPEEKYDLGLAVGIAGEILPETLELMAETSRIVVVDIQALIRTFDPITRVVTLRRLEETPFYSLLHRISYIKAARNEASYIDLETVRKLTCVIVTEGANGSKVYGKETEWRIPPFVATDVDPTGAGDSFLAGFSAGLYQGLSVYQAARMGNYFGALAVEQVGVPSFKPHQLEKLQELRRSQMEASDKLSALAPKLSIPLQNGLHVEAVVNKKPQSM